MQITVFGASGKVGNLIVTEALKRDYSVVAFVHSKSAFKQHKNLRVVKGDIYNSSDVTAAIKGSEAVISALSSWGSTRKDILTAAMQYIIPIMKKNNIKRIISLTGADARAKGDTLSAIHRASYLLIRFFASKVLFDGERHISLLEQSGLNWTVVRSPVMNNQGDPNRYRARDRRPLPWSTINRYSVAITMVDLLEATNQNQKAPFIVRR